jgi:hypothetical protein
MSAIVSPPPQPAKPRAIAMLLLINSFLISSPYNTIVIFVHG